MLRGKGRLWLDLAVGLLGLVVGVSNLSRAFGQGGAGRDLLVGAACIVLGGVWLVMVMSRWRAGRAIRASSRKSTEH